MADSDQTKYNVQGQQMLTDANAEYLTANQMIVYDYNLYDGWFTAEEDEKSEYYRSSFSEQLHTAIEANAEDPFSDSYYESMYQDPQGMFDEADALFQKAESFNQRGDALQLVMLISALGLAFAAWASLLKEDSLVRLVFAVFSIGMLIYSFILYLNVPVVAA
jgi:endo-beta-N-acetylglucosaminidase D